MMPLDVPDIAELAKPFAHGYHHQHGQHVPVFSATPAIHPVLLTAFPQLFPLRTIFAVSASVQVLRTWMIKPFGLRVMPAFTVRLL